MISEYEQAIIDAGVPRSRWGMDGYSDSQLVCDACERNAPRAEIEAIRERCDRSGFVERFSWAIPGEAALRVIMECGPLLEVGAGSGYWAHELAKLGADIIATDQDPIGASGKGYKFTKAWHPVEKMDGRAALKAYPGRALLLVWPCYSAPWSGEVLDAYEGDAVCYVGEGDSGCTGSEQFHAILAERFDLVCEVEIPQWWSIHDRLHVYRRKRKP